MAPATHYPPSLLPWQTSDSFFLGSTWRIELRNGHRGRLLASLHVHKQLDNLWSWWIVVNELPGPAVIQSRRRRGYRSYKRAERALLTALSRHLHPST